MVKTSKKTRATRSRQTKPKTRNKDYISESSDIGVAERQEPYRLKQPFRFLDLPKELQLRIYKMAFQPSGREVSFRIFKNAFNVTRAMHPLFRGSGHSAHPLLRLNSATHKEAMAEFYKTARIDMRCYGDWSLENQKWNDKAQLLGTIPECGVFEYLKNVHLQIVLENVTDLHDFVFGIRQLVNACHRGRYFQRLGIVFHADWEDEDAPNSAQVKFLMAALASFACKGIVYVEWFDGEGSDAFQWVPCEFRNMALDLMETIILNGRAL